MHKIDWQKIWNLLQKKVKMQQLYNTSVLGCDSLHFHNNSLKTFYCKTLVLLKFIESPLYQTFITSNLQFYQISSSSNFHFYRIHGWSYFQFVKQAAN